VSTLNERAAEVLKRGGERQRPGVSLAEIDGAGQFAHLVAKQAAGMRSGRGDQVYSCADHRSPSGLGERRQ
jgi:hypothetical protein